MADKRASRRLIVELGRWAPWLVGGLLSLQLFRVDFIHSAAGRIGGQAIWGRDFVNLWAGGRLLRLEGAERIYDVEGYRAFLAQLFGPLGKHNYSYPPATFPIAEMFSLVPYWLALAIWLAGTGLLFVWAARQWWPRQWGTPLLALLTPAALMNIWAGHYGFLVGALFLLGWQNLDRHPARAGVFFGLMLVKPHLAILIPLVLLVLRRWTAFASAAATLLLLIAATALLYGPEAWLTFLFGTSAVQAGLIDAGQSFYGHMSTSMMTAILRFSDAWLMALGAQVALGTAAAAMILVTARRAATADLAMLVATGTFLVLPYAFNYDMTAVCIAALRLWADQRATATEKSLAVIGFVSPQIGMLVAPLGVPATPLMLVGLFVAQFNVALRSTHGQAASRNPEETVPLERLA